ncbi:MAG: hypothetical protein ABUT20_00400 [Bacteroidota bacterium]
MKVKKSTIRIYPLPVLRIAFRNPVMPGVSRQLHQDDIDRNNPKDEAGTNGKNKTTPEFYQHHIQPKKFDFF